MNVAKNVVKNGTYIDCEIEAPMGLMQNSDKLHLEFTSYTEMS